MSGWIRSATRLNRPTDLRRAIDLRPDVVVLGQHQDDYAEIVHRCQDRRDLQGTLHDETRILELSGIDSLYNQQRRAERATNSINLFPF